MRVLFTMGNFGVEHKERAAPDMGIQKLVAWPSCEQNDVNGSQASARVGSMVKQANSILYHQRPKDRLNDFGPVNGGMQQHGP